MRLVQSPSAVEVEFIEASTANWKTTGFDLELGTGSRYGESVASAGNVDNRDGDDILVGAPKHGEDQGEGTVFLYLSLGGGLYETPAWEKSGGMGGANFGASVAGAGDVNGDGIDDAIIGAPGYKTDFQVGRAYVYEGIAGQGLSEDPIWSYTGTVKDGQVGYAVAGAGDVNGDGIDDIVVGAPGYTDQEGVQDDEGAIFVFFGHDDSDPSTDPGPSTDPDWIIDSDQARARFGASVSAVGNVNDDDYDDLIVGAPRLVRYVDPETAVIEGAVLLFLGGASQPTGHAWIKYGGQAFSWFGSSVAGAGYVNKDPYPDIVVGAPSYDSPVLGGVGAAFAFCGNESGVFDSVPCWMALGDQPYEEYGYGTSVGGAGDVNGDGFDEVIVGAPNYEPDPDTGYQGAVFLYFGSETGLTPWAGWKVGGDRAKTELGFSVGSAGDVDSNGYDDVIIGAPRYFVNSLAYGAAFAFYGPLQPGPVYRTFLPLVLRNSN